MLRLVLLAFLLAVPAICIAQTYKWIDEKGVVGFADDPGKIPEKFRNKAISTGDAQQAVQVEEKAVSDDTAPKKDAAAVKEQKPAATDTGKEKAKQLFDGKDGDAWKRDFARLKHEITSLEEQASGIKSRMANPGKMSRGEYLTLQNTVRDLEARISVSRKKLQALEDAADRADLPAEFR